MRSASAPRRTALLCAVLASTPLALQLLPSGRPAAAAVDLPFFALLGLFFVGGLLIFHVEFREEAHTFTLTEVPLVLGLFLVSPLELLLARLLGELLALVVMPRQPWLKVALNSSLWLAETTLALVVLAALGGPDARDPWTWLAVCAAVLAADALSIAVVHVVISWHGAKPDLRTVALSAGATAAANTCLGLTAVLLLGVHVAAVGLLVVFAAVLFVGYRGYSALQQRYASLRLLHDFTEALDGATSPEQIIAAMLEHARRLLRAAKAELVVLAGDGRPPVRIQQGEDGETRTTVGALPEALLATSDHLGTVRVARGGQVTSQTRAAFDELEFRDGLLTVQVGRGTTGRLVLAVGNRLSDVSTFDAEDERLFETLASHASMALQKGHLVEELRAEAARRAHQAMHDALTGLPNRALFHESAEALVAAAPSTSGAVAILLMDLDGFKDINDTLGHSTGDELLQEVARRLRSSIREGDLAARLGGDEFAILLSVGAGGLQDAEEAAARLLSQVESPVVLNGLPLDLRASIGVALWPEHGDTAEELLQRADVAMYEAKSGGTGVATYDASRDHNTPWRLQLASELRRAIEHGQLLVHYQPKAELGTREISSVEALVRWDHPVHGRIQPDHFIGVAEQTGQITALTYAVLDRVLIDNQRWRQRGVDIGVAVNVAARSLLEPDFVPTVLAALHRASLPPRRLTLELTESSIMEDTRRSLSTLTELAEAGIRLSVDDFGTGYSSLAYLQKLPVAELKVDRSFIFDLATDLSNQAIVRSVIELGHSLGLSVVAEGVENELTWDLLASLGCDVAQGYHLSPPLPPDHLMDWLHRRLTSAREAQAAR